MSEENRKYDKKGNVLYARYMDNAEYYYKYNENNQLIHSISFDDDYEGWFKYNEDNRQISISKEEFKEINFRATEKEYLSRTKVSRFELMEI